VKFNLREFNARTIQTWSFETSTNLADMGHQLRAVYSRPFQLKAFLPFPC